MCQEKKKRQIFIILLQHKNQFCLQNATPGRSFLRETNLYKQNASYKRHNYRTNTPYRQTKLLGKKWYLCLQYVALRCWNVVSASKKENCTSRNFCHHLTLFSFFNFNLSQHSRRVLNSYLPTVLMLRLMKNKSKHWQIKICHWQKALRTLQTKLHFITTKNV